MMFIRILISLLSGLLISIGLVYSITDMYSRELNIYNFAVFMTLFTCISLGLSALIIFYKWIRKHKIKKDIVLKTFFSATVFSNLFLIALGVYFFDDTLPKEFNGSNYVYKYNEPINYKDGILPGSIYSTNFNSDTLKSIMEQIVNNKHYHGMNSFLMWQKGKLIVEEYFYEFNKDKRQDIRSASKSITSLLTGIALDHGYINSIDEKIADYFPEYFNAYEKQSEKFQITIRDLLDMHSCLDCFDWEKDNPGQEAKIYKTDDWIKTVLDLDVNEKDSVYARYCTGGVNVVGEVVARSSKMKLDEFAKKYLFEPLGITNYNYSYTPKNRVDAGGHMYMTARDLMKIGMLVLNNGVWEDKQIISSEWINKCYDDNIKMPDPRLKYPGYGLLWWKIDFGFDITGVQALGNGGQMILVFPELESVIVFTGSNYNNYRMLNPLKIIRSSILPALVNNQNF